MAFYKYEALSPLGKKIRGVIDAESTDQATEKLYSQKILILQLKELHKKCAIPKTAVLLFTRELARLINAGLALYEALQTMEEKYRGTKTHPLFLALLDRIKRGDKLSKALVDQSIFSPLYISMIANAEKTGDLVASLEELTILLSRQDKLKKEIVSALIYPAILSGFCLFVLLSLLYYVVPSLSDLFQGKNLHPMTTFVLSLSNFAIKYQFPLFISFLGTGLAISLCFIFEKSKKIIVQLLLSLPMIKTLFLNLSIIRFSRALGSLLKGGVPFIQGVKLSKEVLTHPKFYREIKEAEEGVLEGKKFSKLLSTSTLIPSLFSRLIAIAEESGKLDAMFFQIAIMYEEEVEKTLTRITSILQPLLLIVLGLVVGFVLLSVLLPLTDVNSFM
jgi:general secretion pathway protein F